MYKYRGLRSASLQGMALGQQQPVSRNSIFSLSFCPLTYLFGNPWTGAKKAGSQILIFELGLIYWGLNGWVPEVFWNLAFL
jgi:hypothetical protein